MGTENWWITTRRSEDTQDIVYGIAHRSPDGHIWRYEDLTTDPAPLHRFLEAVAIADVEECHVPELIENLVTSLYLP